MRWGREMDFIKIYLLLTVVLYCNGRGNKGRRAQVLRLIQRRSPKMTRILTRRYSNPGEPSVILGAPMFPYHLPPAEPVLPGHTLIRPAVGMLKSAVKFPHREHENGSGVYGDFENLGIKYDGRNERVLYTGFRRSLLGYPRDVTWIRYNYPYRPKSRRPIPKKNLSATLSDNHVSKLTTIVPALPEKLGKIKDKPLRFLEKVPDYLIRPNTYYNEKRTRWCVGQGINKISKMKFDKFLLSHCWAKVKNIEVHILEGENLLNFLRWLSSYSQRRDDHETSFEHLEKFKAKYPRPKKYVPGKVKNGQFSIVQPDYEDGEVWNKTAMFWKTKDAFNHIKISPESPDLSELLPPDATEKLKHWWFYHQSDLEELDDE